MIPIGDERHAADLFAHLDAKQRDRLVAEKAEDGGRYDGAEIAHRLGMDETGDRFIAGNERTHGHDEHNHQAGEVFKAAQAIGESLGRFSLG
jgi:hypothetical protein